MKERKNFVEALQKEDNKTKTFTENGATAYESSGKYLLNFNFKLSQYRNMDEEDIKNDFSKVFFEDPLIATKFVFYVGDIRGGLGERKVFNACFSWLIDNKPEIATKLLDLIPEYTRWDNLCKVITSNMYSYVREILIEQLSKDIRNMNEGKSISLLAKWMPSINTSSKETVELAKFICKSIGWTPKQYRKTLAKLRKYLDVVEVKMSSNDWKSIEYSTVPSQANLKYNEAFLRNDAERRIEYLNSLAKGETKINASVSQPHEIVRKYIAGKFWFSEEVKEYDATLEEMWKALPNLHVEDSLVVRDGSGSMRCLAGDGKTSCLNIATALAIYCAEHNSEQWKDKFITFSSRPKFIDLSKCKTLRDKIVRCNSETDCSNTNIAATMDLILDTAIKNNMSQEDMPSNIIIISDMQFDQSRYNGFGWDKTLFEEISNKYNFYGFKLPRIIFWNVCSRDFNTIPMLSNELGLVLCSGFSIANLNMFMSGEINPYKVLVEQINNERYNIIEERVIDIL